MLLGSVSVLTSITCMGDLFNGVSGNKCCDACPPSQIVFLDLCLMFLVFLLWSVASVLVIVAIRLQYQMELK